MENSKVKIPETHLKILYWLIRLYGICGEPLDTTAISIRSRFCRDTIRKTLFKYPNWVKITREHIVDTYSANQYEPRLDNIPIDVLNHIRKRQK